VATIHRNGEPCSTRMRDMGVGCPAAHTQSLVGTKWVRQMEVLLTSAPIAERSGMQTSLRQTESVSMQCPNGCAAPMVRTSGERLFHDREGRALVVTNLALNVCPDCGQESMPLESARTVERTLQDGTSPAGLYVIPPHGVA